jgi:hypothetical protein
MTLPSAEPRQHRYGHLFIPAGEDNYEADPDSNIFGLDKLVSYDNDDYTLSSPWTPIKP